MKRNTLMLAVLTPIVLVVGCREKEVWTEDSPYITVTSPTKSQSIQDSDSIRIKARIEPKSAAVVSYFLSMLGDEKQEICRYRTNGNSKDKSHVVIDTAFSYDINKTSGVRLFIEAELKDGTYIRDETTFKLIDTKK